MVDPWGGGGFTFVVDPFGLYLCGGSLGALPLR